MWPQARDSHVSQNPQGGGGRSATQSRQLYASEPRTQSEAERAVEEFLLFGDRVRALNERVRRETIYTRCAGETKKKNVQVSTYTHPPRVGLAFDVTRPPRRENRDIYTIIYDK